MGQAVPGSGSERLSVVLVDYHRPDLVADALRALAGGTLRPSEVVVVDVQPMAAAPLPEDVRSGPLGSVTQVLATADNPGYAAACNRGAAVTTGEWVLFMNSDVMVDPACLAGVLAEAAAGSMIGAATCRLVLPDGRIDHACHRGIPTPFDSLAYKLRLARLFPRSRRLGHYTLSWLDPSTVHDVEAGSGAFLLVRRAALDAVGGWDERYWFYAEDLDLCLRLTRSGWRVRFVGTATATHLKSATSHLRRGRADLSPEERSTRRRVEGAIVDSHERFYREHLEADTAILLRPLVRLMFATDRLRLRLRDRA
jgi:hypothetical protein